MSAGMQDLSINGPAWCASVHRSSRCAAAALRKRRHSTPSTTTRNKPEERRTHCKTNRGKKKETTLTLIAYSTPVALCLARYTLA